MTPAEFRRRLDDVMDLAPGMEIRRRAYPTIAELFAAPDAEHRRMFCEFLTREWKNYGRHRRAATETFPLDRVIEWDIRCAAAFLRLCAAGWWYFLGRGHRGQAIAAGLSYAQRFFIAPAFARV